MLQNFARPLAFIAWVSAVIGLTPPAFGSLPSFFDREATINALVNAADRVRQGTENGPTGDGSSTSRGSALAPEPKSNRRIRDSLLRLAEDYQRVNRLQEAVWTYRRAGATERADAILRDLVELMKKSNAAKRVQFLEGAGEAVKLELAPGIHAVFKSIDWQKEVFAYELSEALKLNLVPATIASTWRSDAGSLQIFIEDAVPAGVNACCGWQSFRDSGYPDDFRDIYLLDFLLDNSDRHGWNWLIRPGGHPVAIDHGHTFDDAGFRSRVRAELLPRGSLLERLRALDPATLRGIVDDRRFYDFKSRLGELRALSIKYPEPQNSIMLRPLPRSVVEARFARSITNGKMNASEAREIAATLDDHRSFAERAGALRLMIQAMNRDDSRAVVLQSLPRLGDRLLHSLRLSRKRLTREAWHAVEERMTHQLQVDCEMRLSAKADPAA